MSNTLFPPAEAARHSNLVSLIGTSELTNAEPSVRTVHPSEDTIVALLHARARAELPYTRVSSSGTDYIVVNPLRMLGSLGEQTRKAYEDDISRTDGGADSASRPPSVYELAGRVWFLMHRKQESQSIVFHGLTGSGKSSTLRNLTAQLVHLSAKTKVQRRLGDQVNYLITLLESFGNSKTPINPSASQHSRYLELHFSLDGALTGAKILAFGLNKSRIGHLLQEERTFHVFYQLLAGASPEEREQLNLDDPDKYALLSQSNCYRLPGGPFSDDSIQLGELRAALASLGFKSKHVRSIFSILTSILVLSNMTFIDDHATGSLGMSSLDERTSVVERHLLVEVGGHLGVSADELESVLVNRTKWIHRDLCSVFLDSTAAGTQRDVLMHDLYAIMFTFIVEMANKRLSPHSSSPPALQIIQIDLPGYQSRTMTTELSNRGSTLLSAAPLVNASGQNGLEEFAINYSNELIHSYLVRRAFEDDLGWNAEMAADGVRLPHVATMDNAACVELLRGGLLGSARIAKRPLGVIGILAEASDKYKGEEREDIKADGLVNDLASNLNGHPSFVARPPVGLGPMPKDRRMFGINHYAGMCSYDATAFADLNSDVLDKQLVDLLRSSSDPFIAKLVSGPGLATEGHPLDENIVVEAQVSISPLRTPSPVIQPIIGASAQEFVEWPIDVTVPQPVTAQLNSALATMVATVDRTRVWSVYCIRPNDSGHANSFDRRRLKAQVRSLLLPDLVKRRQTDYVADYALTQFCVRHTLPAHNAVASINEFAQSRGWVSGVDYFIGQQRLWLSWDCWREQEDLIRSTETRRGSGEETLADQEDEEYFNRGVNRNDDYAMRAGESTDNLLSRKVTRETGYEFGYTDSPDPGASEVWSEPPTRAGQNPVYGSEAKAAGDIGADEDIVMVQKEKRHQATEVIATSKQRRWWIRITWLLTWWVPSFMLKYIGRMKRADVRMAWREKLAICMMIGFMCGTVIFYIIIFGKLLCPDSDKAWNTSELAQHTGTTDYYAAIAGKVYDFSNFYKGQHSDLTSYPTTPDVMLEFAGLDLTDYFPPPMSVACPNLVNNTNLALMRANFTALLSYAVHTSGPLQTENGTKLDDINWYWDTLQPALEQYYKGFFVYASSEISSAAADQTDKYWATYENKVYDLSDYIYTVNYYSSSSGTDLPNYSFLNSDLSALFEQYTGQDITSQMNAVLDGLSPDEAALQMTCLNNAFYYGELDFRQTARCTVQNYLLLAFSIILMTTIAAKFFAALQLGGKRNPELLDKFVVCQVPCYTEGEESLKKTIDSLAVLNYDDKRKLIFIICDGNIVGSGNNRPTPRIVLDILGVDPKLDPEPLLFKSIGEGSKQLNYGKVYSGLYEHEGHVVPYVVIVKVGKPTETSKPGNRGKRDSQVLLMQYLNRVHFDAPMCPLELEIYHQMRNVIGIDPTFYEYIFQVDADTTVTPDSLNRLISCAADDSRIIGICGETKLANERESLTTMIQVYEYYISHHLTKAFESLFGSVTCLPGCFSVYRIRTADKGRPVIISSVVIDEYAEPNVDTLHKKNLFSLGEDRYLSTLMMKHFPTSKMKFAPDAIAHTVAPSRWNVLLSQRRRWINSTIHNLTELLFLPEMCGFCLFSMRFIVFIDLLGTIILPATCAYLIYLIVTVATGQAAIPVISLCMIAAVYGLQAIIFILKREFMLIGWMVVYLLAFPIYSVFLPCYSFWSMDDFSWGNTRKVIGEGNNKTVVYDDEERFEESMIPYRTFREYESNAWETASLHSEKSRATETRTERSRGRPFMSNGSQALSIRSSYSNIPPESDYYRDSSPLGPNPVSHRQNTSAFSSRSPSRDPSPAPFVDSSHRATPMTGLSQWGQGSVYDQPLVPPMPFGRNPFDSPAVSDHPSLRPPSMYPVYPQQNTISPASTLMTLNMPRSTMISAPGYGVPPPLHGRISTYSLASTANPFGMGGRGLDPNIDPSPSDESVLSVLRLYLTNQDLMTVTKRSAREALYGLFPNANLQSRAVWLNENIDTILSEP